MKFTFRARNPEGRTVTVSCQAADESTARQQLKARGYQLLTEAPMPAALRKAPPPRVRPSRKLRRAWSAPPWWRRLAGLGFLTGVLWMGWGVTRSGPLVPPAQAQPLAIRLQGVKPKGEGTLVFSFPELPLVVTRPLKELKNPYELTVELKSPRRPTYGLVRTGNGLARRFNLAGEPLTGQVPAPAGP